MPDEPDLLADYADALAMSQGRDLSGKPLELVKRALKIDPTHWKALAMAGTAAFDRKDYKGAVDYWERLRSSQPRGFADRAVDCGQHQRGTPARRHAAGAGWPAAPQKAAPAAMPPAVAAAPATGTDQGRCDRDQAPRSAAP